MAGKISPQEFVAKWKDSGLSERASAQSHFIDLCALLGEPAPTDAGATGASYTFELDPGGASEAELRTRTLTKLYNQRPTWLDLAHTKLDRAVFAAYGWPEDLADEQILERLLALNLERSGGTRTPVADALPRADSAPA